MKKIDISGMHCESCSKLILMEIEDAALEDAVESINEQSELIFADAASDEDIQKIKTIINGMEGYSVSEK